MAYGAKAADHSCAAVRVTLWPGMQSYSFHDSGALTAVKTADGQTEQQTFTYHPTGLMSTALFNNQTQTLTNLWDADEHRVGFCLGACQSSTSFTFVYDPTASIPAVLKEATPGDHYYYIREPDGSLIARVGPETMHYYHFDELGSTRLITENSGIVTDRYTYDAYGAVLTHEASDGTIDQPYQYVGRLGYYTHYQAPELGWLQLGVRFYEPEIGRFERRDPVPRPERTLYGYSASTPTVGTDASGREVMLCRRLIGAPATGDLVDYARYCLAACAAALTGQAWHDYLVINGTAWSWTGQWGISNGDAAFLGMSQCWRLRPTRNARKQEECLAKNLHNAQRGDPLCGRRYLGPGRGVEGTKHWLERRMPCRSMISCLLHDKCGGWEQDGAPFTPVVR